MQTNRPFEHRHYGHCETGVLSSLLKHEGLELSEPMVFGLASGIMFAYIPFIGMNNMPTISYRSMPRTIISGIQKILQIPFVKKTYGDEKKAMEELKTFALSSRVVALQTSAYWLPYFPPEMRFQFNAHNLIIFGMQNGEFQVSDPVFDHVVTIAPEDLQNARFAKGLLSPKGFLYYPEVVPLAVDLPTAIRKSFKKTLFMMLSSPPPFGIRGIFYIARVIERMGQKRDQRYIRAFLGHMVRMQEEIGTGGGGFRFMYAAFLHEASMLLSEPVLLEASRRMTTVGDLWRQFALACAKAIRNKTEAPDLAMIAGLLRKCGEVEREVYQMIRTLS